jgi:RNA polymerase sigma-70 factor (sigma-E family)
VGSPVAGARAKRNLLASATRLGGEGGEMSTVTAEPVAGVALGWSPVSRGNVEETSRSDFVEYVEARQQALVRFAYLLTSDHHTAEDLVQTALAKTYLTWDRLRDRGAIDAYVRRIIINENTSMWRRAWKRRERSTDQLPDRGHSDPDADNRDAMWQVVQTLPPKQRAAVVLRYYEDLSEADTAEVLGCSVGNVKSQTSRGIAAIRAAVMSDPGLLGGHA